MIVASKYMEQVWRPIVDRKVPISVVEYPIDSSYFALRNSAQRRAAKAALGLGDGQVTVGFFGRVEPIKGLHVLAEAMGLLAKRNGKRPSLIVQGAPNLGIRPSQTAEFRRTCDALLGSPAIWLPAGPDIRLALAACDIVAVPVCGRSRRG